LLKWNFLFHIELMQGHMEMVGDTFLLHCLCQMRKPIFGGPYGWSSWWASIKNLLSDHCWDFSHSGYLVVVTLGSFSNWFAWCTVSFPILPKCATYRAHLNLGFISHYHWFKKDMSNPTYIKVMHKVTLSFTSYPLFQW